MKTTLHLWASAAGLLISLLPGPAAHAEGSKQLTPNRTGTPTSLTDPANTITGYLMHDSGPASTETFLKPNAPADHRLFVRLKPGETLYYGLQRTDIGPSRTDNQNDVVITIKYLDDTGAEQVAQTSTLARDQAAGNLSQARLLPQPGVIDDATQNQAGPRTAANPTGYDALTVTYPATGTSPRDYWVELTQVDEASLVGDLKRSYYNFWDFTVVSPAGQEQPGRLFSQFWGFSSGPSAGAGGLYQNRLSADFSLFTLIPNPQDATKFFVKQVELAGLRPYDFVFVANSRGTGTPGTFAESRKSVAGASTPTEYNNFVNDPDPSLWPSATAPVFVRTAKAFCNPLTGLGGVAFTTTSGEQGSVTVLIDLNGNKVQDGNDVLLTQNVTANQPATIVWDGRDRLGNVVAPGTSIDLAFTSFGAPVNYPLYDAEGNPDGLRIQNVRPSSGAGRYFDRLYWDDTNLSATDFPDQARLNGEISTAGVHLWGDASNEAGNTLTINTWSYGFITPIDQVYVYEYTCDNDNDGVTDATDLDDDNDGIPDTQETGGVDPQLASGNTLLYLDAAYMHPIFGRFRDRNNDGINDWFDTDLDGVPNHFDLDSDHDGLPDAVEAGLASLTWNNGANGSQYSAAESRFAGPGNPVGPNGLPNAVENRTQPDTEVNTVRYTLPDNDGDTFVGATLSALNYNYLDLDSDNDGLTDELEAQSTAAYTARLGSAAFATDSNKNGLRDAYDANNGGSAVGPAVDTNRNTVADMFDFDTDGDNAVKSALPIYLQTADWTEGFDTSGDGRAGDEILAKALAFATANPAQAAYYAVTDGVRSPFLQDANGNGVPNFLERGAAYYHDDNFNGLIDLYDPAYGGRPGTAPRASEGAPDAIFRSLTAQVPLPVTLVRFEARAAGPAVVLSWRTAQELHNHHFVVERSLDGRSFGPLMTVPGQGTTAQPTDYTRTDADAAALGVATLYYRLQAVDDEGQSTLSPVRAVRLPQVAAGQLALYPNPAADHATLDLRSLPAGDYSVQVFDATGRRLQQATYPAGLPVLDLRALPAGAYFVQVRGEGLNTVLPLLRH